VKAIDRLNDARRDVVTAARDVMFCASRDALERLRAALKTEELAHDACWAPTPSTPKEAT
jgi:hypothetical protein